MMKRAAFIAAVVVMMLLTNKTKAGVSEIVNGSFEDDGYIADITEQEPNGWDVNVPGDEFLGWVDSYWSTDGEYSLALVAWWYPYFGYEVNDMATVSQDVYLYDVNEVVFDLKLDTYPFPWDPNKRSAILLVDNEVVWDSDDWQPDANNEYRNQVVDIDIDDMGLHKLSLGIRADVNETTNEADTIYYSCWDAIEFNPYCDGFGLLFGDFNRDCYVDMDDLEMLAEVWLDEVDPIVKYNLYRGDEAAPYGVINFLDFAVFADSWDGNIPDLKMFTEVWLDEVDPDNEYNLFRDDDVYPNGIINFLDFAIFAENWMDSSYD